MSTTPATPAPDSGATTNATATAPDLSVAIGSLRLRNPFMAASGCFGYGVEYADAVDLSALGAVVVKGLFLKAREGHQIGRAHV